MFSTIELDLWCGFSRKKKIISLSTTEAEYRGVVQAGTKAVWIRQILVELGLPIHT
jgi:hypothetical protein